MPEYMNTCKRTQAEHTLSVKTWPQPEPMHFDCQRHIILLFVYLLLMFMLCGVAQMPAEKKIVCFSSLNYIV